MSEIIAHQTPQTVQDLCSAIAANKSKRRDIILRLATSKSDWLEHGTGLTPVEISRLQQEDAKIGVLNEKLNAQLGALRSKQKTEKAENENTKHSVKKLSHGTLVSAYVAVFSKVASDSLIKSALEETDENSTYIQISNIFDDVNYIFNEFMMPAIDTILSDICE
jgi:hypothetical protein